MKRIVTILIFGLLTQTIGYTQGTNIGTLFKNNEDKGDEMFNDLYFEQAIEYYKSAWKKDKGNADLMLKVAESYRRLQEYKEAREWFEMALNTSVISPINKYYYAETLTSIGKYDEAVEWYDKYLAEVPEDSRSARKIDGLNGKRYFFRDSTLVDMHPINVNSNEADFGVNYYKDGIIFLSARTRELFIDNDVLREESLLDLYYSKKDSAFKFEEPTPFSKIVNTKYHEGPVTFSNDGQVMIFCRSNYLNGKKIIGADGKTKIQLFIADKDGNSWKNVRPFPFNNINYNLAHPSLTASNDSLFFSSDMPEGFGGSDIYLSVKNQSVWSKPVNMGPDINTEGDEMYPLMVQGRLFFSSNGFAGLGGMDIYKALIEDGKVKGIVNLGYPINSSYDEIGYLLDPITLSGYISSNRPGGSGKEDIYQFKQLGLLLNGVAKQSFEETPISGAVITLYDNHGNEISSVLSDDDGSYHFYLPIGGDFSIQSSKSEYTLDAPVKVSTKGNRIDLDTAEVYMWKHELFAKGRIFSNEEQILMEGVKVRITNLTDGTTDSVTTSPSGEYYFLLQRKNKYRIVAEKENYIPNGFDLSTIDLQRGDLLNDIVLEEEFLDKAVIFFEFDKSFLRPDAFAELNRMLSYLKKHPKAELTIGAHADSFGDKPYNQKLSDRRANSTLQFFITNGISAKRIIARGFGEELLINRCSDGVECPESEHSKNRRAELKINDIR